jgi:hypothetical protein
MSTVEAQIREARERADMFASSLNKAKEQEGYFEEERQKWVLSFEEKSSMIEQLERELTSTVDALNREKQEKSMAQKVLMQSTADSSALSHSRESTSMRRSLISGHVDKSNVRHEYPERSSFGQDHTSDADASSRRVLELLQQSQEETTQVRRDLSVMRVERDRLSDQITVMKRQMERIIDEKEQLSKSLKNSENRMLFRDKQVGVHSNFSSCHFNSSANRQPPNVLRKTITQVSEHELERERNTNRETELTEIITTLEKQLSSQRIELQAVGDHRSALENTVIDLTRKIHDPASSIQDRFDKMEKMATELTRRAESAEDTLRTLMDVGADFEIPRGRSTDPETIDASLIGIAGVRALDSIHDGPIRTWVDFTKFTSEYGIQNPSEISMLDLRRSKESGQKHSEELSRNQNQIQEFGSIEKKFTHYAVRPDEMKELPRPPVAKKSVKSKSKSKSLSTRSAAPKECSAVTPSSVKRSKISNPHRITSEKVDSKLAATSRKNSRNHNLSLGSEYGNNLESKFQPKKFPIARSVPPTPPSEKPRLVRCSSQPVLQGRSSQYGRNDPYVPVISSARPIVSSRTPTQMKKEKTYTEKNSSMSVENNGNGCRTPGKSGHQVINQTSSATRLVLKKSQPSVPKPGRGVGSSAVISDVTGRYKLQVRHLFKCYRTVHTLSFFLPI